MKKWLIFAGLKIVEITVFVIAIFAITKFGVWWLTTFDHCHCHYIAWWKNFFVGAFIICMAIAIILAVYTFIFGVIPWFYKKNIEWSEKLTRRLTK